MSAMGISQSQRAVQIQSQKMSQRQIYSLNLLNMNSQDLRGEIFKAVEENPALEITKDPLNGVSNINSISKNTFDYGHYGSNSATGQEKADKFQAVLEAQADERETLYQHLMDQLEISRLTKSQYKLCCKLVENLDTSGFHILAPESLLDKTDLSQTSELLAFCLDFVQNLDPIGTCCKNFQESLLIQAKDSFNSTDAALFLLDGHFDFLQPPRPAAVLKKIQDFVKDQKKMMFTEPSPYNPESFTLEEIEEAINFIKTLDPKPAREFQSVSQNSYVAPDVYVTRIPEISDGEEQNLDTVEGFGRSSFKISVANNTIPTVSISKEFSTDENEISETSKISTEQKKFVEKSVKDAKIFLEDLEYRNLTIVKACTQIVREQLEFFEKGPKFLKPLRQKDIAEKIGVHEATISRMSNSKYLECEWGLFPIKFFFASGIVQNSNSNFSNSEDSVNASSKTQNAGVSKETVKIAIAEIINSQNAGEKKLSDQKIVNLLEQRGIKIARRTVAKYRGELKIDSSFDR